MRPWLLLPLVQVLLDGICGAAAIVAAYVVRFDLHPPLWAERQMWTWALLLLFLNPFAISIFGGHRTTWQYFGVRDLTRLAQRIGLLNASVLLMANFSSGLHLMPYGVAIINFLLALFLCGGARLLRRIDHEGLLRLSEGHRILVVGTDHTIPDALRQLVPLYGWGVRGAVTQGASFSNRSILGVRVLGTVVDLAALISIHRVTLLFLCCGEMEDIPEIIQIAADLDIPVKLLPSVRDLMDNNVRVSKPVNINALRRTNSSERIELGLPVIECLRDRVVLVTGAGGSIGSELIRQVSKAPIRKLILVDQDENAVFELLSEFPNRRDLLPIIADIRDRAAIRRIFSTHQPQVVLHAAAYKHVPMMEANPCEAVLNNVMGTRNLAEIASEFRVERMVMISSDKAVRPSSVMGATKRVAEVVIQQIARADNGAATKFACVRFGNVLGSRGSVLPMFLKQIEQGGPLTVTHADMTRYFMTIPQAVHLVLQAATLGSHGHVYMLEMGDPVRILSFAREVIHLAGLTPDKDNEIKIVGSRPGEKLHEQLWGEGSQVTPTTFDHIYKVHAEDPDRSFPALLDQLEEAAIQHRADAIRDLLRRLPIDYLTARADVQTLSEAIPPILTCKAIPV